MTTLRHSHIREASKALFGNSYRLEMLAIIGELGNPFQVHEVAASLGVADNLVTSQVARLCDLGLLDKVVVSRQVLYTRRPSGIWAMAAAFRDELARSSADDEPAIENAVRPSAVDLYAIAGQLAAARSEREQPGSEAHRYLDHPIHKPWGYEYRVYDDALRDIWVMDLMPGRATSMHAHMRIETVLLCIAGDGAVATPQGRPIALAPGSVVRISPGAYHRVRAASGLMLVEVSTPRDKFDLVRLEDDAGRAGMAYEGSDWAAIDDFAPLVTLPSGPPMARLRADRSPELPSFDVELGGEIRRRPSGLIFAIELDAAAALNRRSAIYRGGDVGALVSDELYLAIREETASPDVDGRSGSRREPAPAVRPQARRRIRPAERTLFATPSLLRGVGVGVPERPAVRPTRPYVFYDAGAETRKSWGGSSATQPHDIVPVRVEMGWGEVAVPDGEVAREILGMIYEDPRHRELSPELDAVLAMLTGTIVGISVPNPDGGRIIWTPDLELLDCMLLPHDESQDPRPDGDVTSV
jgi:mannose-6-phosphate isomerase-like protein (cupin superfamily)